MTIQEIFINNLKSFRKRANLTQSGLSIQIDKSYNYINGIECGASFPPPAIIDKIAEALKIQTSQLFDINGCEQNIINSNKDVFIDLISTRIVEQLKPTIKEILSEEIK
ncbi:MAG: helix-turn-helix transcriptional regulator [Spirochaetia bacterium]|nr:helix-turn-helix transcriptional regulator [Spirochaetia bacterium]MBR5017550.1 helix-turn-helix transcriptional regulator [Spirochaetia bacterium]